MTTSCFVRRIVPVAAAVAVFAAGVVAGMRLRGPEPQRVFAATAAADESFAACTAPVGDGMEGLFLLDFETGDLTGGVLNRATAKFTTGYRYNVLKDLEFKAGKVKNPKFLLTTGMAEFNGGAAGAAAGSVLYVTDASTGVTVAYGIPWNAQQSAAGGPAAAPFVPLDMARPRGGKAP
jgi:hypothetical protein